MSEENNSNPAPIQTLNRIQLQREGLESTSRAHFQMASSAVTAMDSNQLESVINNFNRIVSQCRQNINTNWLQSFYDLMKSELTRLRSFHARQHAKWNVQSVTPEELARAGFFFLYEDRVQCAFCRGVVHNWEPGDRPLREHAIHFPRCPYIMGEDVGNQPIEDDPIRGPKRNLTTGYDVCGNFTPMDMHSIGLNNRNATAVEMQEYGVQPHRGPKNANYKSIDARLRSYMTNKWSPSVAVDTKSLAEAGFYSVGVSDYVKCFYCDGGLFNWEEGDDPWIEHAKWFPDCQFVVLNKSQTFIEECRRLAVSEGQPQQQQTNSNSEQIPDPECYSPVGSDVEYEDIDALGVTAVNEWMNSDIVLQLIDLNAFPDDIIKAVLYKRWGEDKQPFTSFAHLYDAVSQWRGPPTLQITERQTQSRVINSDSENEYISSISEEEEYNSGNDLPASQLSSASTLSTYSSSPEVLSSNDDMESSQSSPKSEDNRLLCKICLDREIGVVFLPCGHQLACTQCAPCVTDCPICRKVIRGTVRTFFS